jgi:hypothetical protein
LKKPLVETHAGIDSQETWKREAIAISSSERFFEAPFGFVKMDQMVPVFLRQIAVNSIK